MRITKEDRKCPLCGEDNGCQHGKGDCWCNNVVVPKHIMDMIPEDKKGKACVCKSCIEKYAK